MVIIIYDGLNKGVALATGDVICFLHSDDIYTNNTIIEKVVKVFKTKNVDGVYGDLIYVKKENTNKIVRYWSSGDFKYKNLKKGWMPPHPTLFLKRDIYKKFGYFNKNLKISADYDFLLRVLSSIDIKIYYLKEVLYVMRIGGTSNKNIKNIFRKSFEDYIVLRKNKIGGIITLFRKNFSKIGQFFFQ